MVSVSGTEEQRGGDEAQVLGLGLAGDGLEVSEIEQLGATFARRFGIDGVHVREPPRVVELDLHTSRLAPSASLERRRSAQTRTTGRPIRASGRSAMPRAVLLGLRAGPSRSGTGTAG
jgi:hypothetical protein